MIRFSLHCEAGHDFESWFRDGASFERQHARGQVACPECGSSAVEKAPMAPRLGRSRDATPGPERPPSPAELQHHLRALRRHVETHCEHVGPRFADEARKIHRGEAEPRGIYGEATPRESEALADDGIEVARIPWIPLSDA
jgi:hypothetical protein